MKNVDYLIVIPKLGLWSSENNARVRDEFRSLCYFLGMKLHEAKIKSNNFSGIYFIGEEELREVYFMNSLMVISVKFIESLYPSKGDVIAINEYLIERINDGLLKVKEKYSEIFNVIIQGIEEFRKADYKCIWIHKKKKIKKYLFRLRCEMNIDYFHLYLEILDKDLCVIFSKIILETPPNEYSFKYRFKDLKIDDEGNVVVTDCANEVWYKFNPKDEVEEYLD
ncbi:hypothetical protein ACYU0V_12575 [Acinetobacter sp. X9]